MAPILSASRAVHVMLACTRGAGHFNPMVPFIGACRRGGHDVLLVGPGGADRGHAIPDGRARSVVALAPAGGWAPGDESFRETLGCFATMKELLAAVVPHADAIVASPEGRRRATEFYATNFEHIPGALIAHLMRGAAP